VLVQRKMEFRRVGVSEWKTKISRSRPASLSAGRDVPDRAVQPHVVVMLDVPLTRRRASSSDRGVPGRMHSALRRRASVPVCRCSAGSRGLVRTWVIPQRRMNSLKSLAMNCGPLSEMIRGRFRRGTSPRPLEDDLHVGFGHRLADLPVDDVPAAAVQDAAQVVERAADVDVRDVDVPVLVRPERLHEARALSCEGLPFQRPSRPASSAPGRRWLGLTATTSASSIMNVSRR
jgi:hypothetical protein